jgi:hypothetical protein
MYIDYNTEAEEWPRTKQNKGRVILESKTAEQRLLKREAFSNSEAWLLCSGT